LYGWYLLLNATQNKMNTQVNEIVKLVTILQDIKVSEMEKLVAERRLQEIKDEITASQYNLPKDRISDVQSLERVMKDPTMTKFHRIKAEEAIKKIVREDHNVREMRRSLIKEAKAGRVENLKDIREIVSKHSKYQ
jgi:hypothetical protein